LSANFTSERVSADALSDGEWLQPLQRLLARARPSPVAESGLHIGCDAILELLDGRGR
jgi:hypothetical protein